VYAEIDELDLGSAMAATAASSATQDAARSL